MNETTVITGCVGCGTSMLMEPFEHQTLEEAINGLRAELMEQGATVVDVTGTIYITDEHVLFLVVIPDENTHRINRIVRVSKVRQRMEQLSRIIN